ncbi:hypothetical protein POSPLADRAFT_1145484 [Postia placenta MAD-698-R-SB12]|uniref:Uncharacterized protein n=1 Tax=Postia placenta MAD-698-R-SB12 TaxID=670580 RepID=A0A1X6N050_9APHY|nr:hypothetical protein POSPLADRAFT_1145484 [Postia placenta MAD-698-R-SB12]OSX61856.1 hypothetical protein POSPLADRAFT_1145484 [Postia placenta MAD-698-R-SB12]
MPSAKPYGGTTRKLVIAFDVGTTYSGIAYALLDPGEVPKIQGVTRFPGQENAAGDSKIPSILYYNPDGSVRAVGAEAALPSLSLDAEDEGLYFVEWFKLHLRPGALASEDAIRSRVPPLPFGKSVTDIFADFMAYLFSCARRYIIETHANGDRLWSSVEKSIEFVLSHPNGWEGNQQTKMRRAAVQAGLIPDTPAGYARVHFVTEGEAGLHFCVQSGLATESVKNGHSVVILDAGGGTVDLSTYKFASVLPMAVEEIVAPDCKCIMQGSTTVNARAGKFLEAKLKDSAYGNEEDIRTMLECFEKSTKPIFKDASETSYIRFGSMSCNDPAVGIRRGQLVLAGSDVGSFFQPAIDAIVEAVQKQKESAPAESPLGVVFLVGGFAASPWLFSQLQNALWDYGLSVSRPDRHTSKAVAEGAVSFYLDHWVSARVARVTYGIECTTHYNESKPDHLQRRGNVRTRPSGRQVIPDHFSAILAKGTRIREDEEVSHGYYKEAREAVTLNRITAEITCYRGRSKEPCWTDIEPEMYSTLCTVHADTSRVLKVMQHGENGIYYTQDYKVVLLCGTTELKAQISWMEDVGGFIAIS